MGQFCFILPSKISICPLEDFTLATALIRKDIEDNQISFFEMTLIYVIEILQHLLPVLIFD